MSDAVMVPRDAGPNFSDSTLPEEMIYAGIAVLDQVEADNANYVAGETTDWDQGMVAVAIYRAMTEAGSAMLAASTPVGGWEEPVATYGQKGRALYEAFWARNGDTNPTPWPDQARAIRTMWMNIARDAEPLYAAPPPPSVSTGSRPQEAVPTEQAAPPVVATLTTLLDNLVIAQSLSRICRQHATDEARSYLYDLRHQPADGCSSNEGAGA